MSDNGVLIVAQRALPSRGGLAVATSRIAALAAKRGERVHLLCTQAQGQPGGLMQSERDGVIVHSMGQLESEDVQLRALVEHGIDLAQRYRCSVVHGIYATQAGYAATIIARRLAMASVVSMRGNDLDEGLYRQRELGLVHQALQHATILTGVSSAHCHSAAALLGREAYFVGNSVDCERFSPVSRELALQEEIGSRGAMVLGYLGELREKKGLRFLLPAFALLARERDLRLLLIGGLRSDALPAYEAFCASEPEMSQHIHIVDYARSPKRIRSWLALCDLLVFPSLREGMPNAVLEAMACARPVLATAVAGHNDIIEHGKTGALLGLDRLAELPQAMVEMLDHPQREAMGQAARRYVEQKHGSEAESAAWAEVYRLARAAPIARGEVRRLYPK